MPTANDYLQSILSAISKVQVELRDRPVIVTHPRVLEALRELDDFAHEACGNVQDTNEKEV